MAALVTGEEGGASSSVDTKAPIRNLYECLTVHVLLVLLVPLVCCCHVGSRLHRVMGVHTTTCLSSVPRHGFLSEPNYITVTSSLPGW